MGNSRRWALRSRVIGCAFAIAAPTIIVGVAQGPVVAAPAAPTVAVYGSAASPIAPGATALIDAAVRNSGETDLTAPVTLTVSGLSAGVTLASADLDLIGRSWDCAGGTVCTLVGPDGTTHANLDALEIAQTRLRLAVDAGAAVASTVTIALAADAGASDPPADLSAASTTVDLIRLAAGTPGALEVVAENDGLVAGEQASTTLRIANLGPSSIGGAGATLVADGVLAPGSTNWTVDSAGWNCIDSGGLPVCTWTGAATGVGSAVTPLVIDFVAPPSDTTGGPPLSWTQTVTHTSSTGATIIETTELVAAVLTDVAPIASVFALSTGRPAVERGGAVDLLVGMAGSGLDDSSRTVAVAATLPPGWSFTEATGPWTCSTDVSQLTCDRSADFGGESESSTTITLQTDDGAAQGPQTLTFTGSVSGPDTEASTTDDVTVEVTAVGAPLSRLRIFHYPTPDMAIQVSDGAPLPLAPGTPALLGIDIANSGTTAVPAGSTLTFSIEVPDGATVDEVSGDDAWSCSSTAPNIVTCTTTVDADVAPDATTPTAILAVDIPLTTPTGPQTWPLVITGEVRGQPLLSMGSNGQVPVVVQTASTAAPALGLDVDVIRSPRETFALSLIEVTPSNGGNEEMSDGWEFTVELPRKLTGRDARIVPASCTYVEGKKKNPSTITCSSSESLAPGASGEPLVIPVWTPGATGEFEIVFEGTAAGAEDVTIPLAVEILPALEALATATPDRVVLPPDDSTPVANVLLDGRASVDDGASTTAWTQIDNGAPVVTFDGFAPGDAAIGLLTSFTPPTVSTETTLSFRLTLSDDKSSSTVDVDVVIEPLDAPQPDATPASSEPVAEPLRAAPSSFKSAATSSLTSPSFAALAVSTGSGSWTWTTPPTISKNDHDNTIDNPVWGSRARVLDDGTYTWDGPGPLPTDITVTADWQECDTGDPGGPSCSIVASGGVYLVPGNGRLIEAVITIGGTDSNNLPVSTTETYSLGDVVTIYEASTVLVPPSISGVPDAGNLLTGNPGEWSLQFGQDLSWLTCTGPDIGSCTDIPGETGNTYVVQPGDIGNGIRFKVVAYALEGNLPVEAVSSAVQSGVTVGCGSDCYAWSVDPIVDPNGIGQPTPVTGLTATLIDDGTYTWNDPTAAPTTVTSEVAWFECDVANPTTCTSVSTGRTHTPTTPDVLLEARLTLSGSFAVDGTVRTGTLAVPFGVVREAALPPVATTLPSISGSTLAGDVLSANSGVWIDSPTSDRTYSWLRCTAADPDQCTPVGVATQTYTVQVEDLTEFASVMRVDVTAPGYVNSGTARSTPSGTLTDNFKHLITPPTIDGGLDGPRVGVEATATQAVWSEMPPTLSGPALEWQRCTSSDTTSCGSFALTTGETYVPIDGLENSFLRVRATIVGDIPNGGTSEEEAFSGVIGPVLPVMLAASTDLPGGTASIANAETLDVVGQATDGAFPFDFVWTQTSGPSVITDPVNGQNLRIVAPATGTGLLEFRLTVTDANLESATTDITVEYGANAGPAELCDAVDLARDINPGLKTLTYGDIRINFASGTATPGPCSTDSVVTIANAFVTAYGWINISDVTVTIDVNGITLSGSAILQLVTGTAIDASVWALSPDASLTVPFEGDGTYEFVGAMVSSGRPPLIDLVGQWTGATRIAFGNGQGVQTISFGAVAWDGLFGSATPVPGQLPTPPAGAPTVTLNGSMATDTTFSFSLATTGLVDFAGSGIDFAGTVSRPDPAGGVVFTANGSLASPVALADNVVLQSASLTWDGESFAGDGAVTLTVNGDTLDIAAGFSFTDPSRWMAALTVNAGGTWSPVSGLDLSNPTMTGTLSRSGSDTRIDITIGADAVEIGSGVELTNPSLLLNGSCASNDCGFDIGFSTGLTVTMFGGSLSTSLSGTLNTSTGAFDATATLGAFTIVDGLSFNSAELHIDNASGLAIELTTSVDLFGSLHDVTIRFDDAGAVVLVDNGTWTPFDGAPTFEDSWLIYSSYSTTVNVDGQDVSVLARTLQLSADAGVPQWFADIIGNDSVTATVTGRLALSPLSFDFAIAFDLGDIEVLSIGGVTLTADELTFRVTATGTQFQTVVVGNGMLSVPSTGSAPDSELDVQVVFFFQPTTGSFSGSLTLMAGPSGTPVWEDAFGVAGLTINYLSASIGVSNGGIQLGFAGDVTLPDAWEDIGVASGTRLRLVAAIAGPSSCFGIEIGIPGQATDAINVGNLDALTAKHASLYIAPTGCQIGITTIDPGIALSFDGAILDYDVNVDLAITPSPFRVDASIELGDIELKELSVENTSIEITLSAAEQRLAFSADATVFGAKASVSGQFRNVAGISTIEFHGTFTTPDLGGFQVDELTVDFVYTQLPQELSVDARLAVTVLGQPQVVELSFSMLNGIVYRASGSANISFTIEELAIQGIGEFEFVRGSFPTITIDGSASVDGRQLTAISGTLREGYLEFSAELNIGGVFKATPTLSGVVAWQSTPGSRPPMIRNVNGDLVTASAGDFRFDATNIGLNISGVDVGADVSIGNVDGVFFAGIAAELNFGLSGFASTSIDFAGAFDSTGDFSLSGNGALRIGGVNAVTLSFAMARNGNTVAVAAAGSITIPNLATVTIDGSFTSDATHGWLYTLNGQVAVGTDDFDFGTGQFAAYRQIEFGRIASGMEAAISVAIPDLAAGSASVAIFSNGNFAFDANFRTQGQLKSAIGDVNAAMAFSHTPASTDYSFMITVKDVMKVPGSFTLRGDISSGGGFFVQASVVVGPWSASKDLGVCTGRVSANGSFDITILSTSSVFFVGVSLDANAAASCGAIGISAGVTADFTADLSTTPGSFTLRAKARLNFGSPIGVWRPSLYVG